MQSPLQEFIRGTSLNDLYSPVFSKGPALFVRRSIQSEQVEAKYSPQLTCRP